MASDQEVKQCGVSISEDFCAKILKLLGLQKAESNLRSGPARDLNVDRAEPEDTP